MQEDIIKQISEALGHEVEVLDIDEQELYDGPIPHTQPSATGNLSVKVIRKDAD
jgi:hypothetical protein